MDYKSFFANFSIASNNYPWLVTAWLIFGGIAGFAGFYFAGGHIPIILLGGIFGLAGALTHLAIIALQARPYFWIAGSLIAAAAFSLTAITAPIQIWLYAVASYFILGSAYYLLLDQLFLRER